MHGKVGLAIFFAAEIVLVVTPMMFPAIPPLVGIILYAIAALLLLYAVWASRAALKAHIKATWSSLPRLTRRRTIFNPDGLAWGGITISDDRLRDDLFFTIRIRCFNGTGRRIKLDRADGNISCSVEGNARKSHKLPSPTLAGTFAVIDDRQKFNVELEQRVQKVAAEMMLGITDDQSLTLRLANLKLIAATIENTPAEVTIQVPNGVGLKRYGDHLQVDSSQLVRAAPSGPVGITGG